MSQHAKNVHSKQITLFSRSKSDSKKSGRTQTRRHGRTDGQTHIENLRALHNRPFGQKQNHGREAAENFGVLQGENGKF